MIPTALLIVMVIGGVTHRSAITGYTTQSCRAALQAAQFVPRAPDVEVTLACVEYPVAIAHGQPRAERRR